MTHGSPENPEKNPHPVKRYEVTVTADGPGPWDSVKGYINYQVVNPNCTPEDKFLGVHALPRVEGHHIDMTRMGDKTWKGHFYRDFMLDEDYYGLGNCHWDATSVAGVFVAHGEVFGPGSVLEDFLRNGPQTSYFKKSEYLDHSLAGDSALDASGDNPEVVQHPDAFFPMTVTVKEATP
jgi:hypothetical protein